MNEETERPKIDKGIPIPFVRTYNKRVYPFRDMEIGDSFFINRKRTTVAAAAVNYAYLHPEYKFTTVVEGEGTRVWRIEAPKKK